MSVRSERQPQPTAAEAMEAAILNGQPASAELAEGSSFSTASPDNPLTRNLVVTIRASLNDLCLQKNKACWSPSSEALRQIFQQRKFTSLDGTAEAQGDLKVRTRTPMHAAPAIP